MRYPRRSSPSSDLRARGDARQCDGREAVAQLAFGSARCAGARRRSALPRAGRARAAGLGGRRLSRCRAHLDRQLRAGEARDQGTQPLWLTSRSARSLSRPRSATRSRRASRCRRVDLHGSERSSFAVAASTEIFGWMVRNPEKRLARALAKPGHELQHRFATAEPSPEQIEVAEAALAACLELERE